MENTIKVTILPEDFMEANGYEYMPCPLHVALKRMGFVSVYTLVSNVEIDCVKYKIPEKWGEWKINGTSIIYKNREAAYQGEPIDDIIDKAKVSLEGIPTVELTLHKILEV